MSNPNPAVDLATALVAGGVVALLNPPAGSVTVGYGVAPFNVMSGPERESDDFVTNQLINLVSTGGPAPLPLMGQGLNVFRARVQVMVRSQIDAFKAGDDLARAALRKLHTVDLSASGYIDVLAQETEPNYLGVDERQVHRWSFNLLVRWQE